jgi:hypothetical protein
MTFRVFITLLAVPLCIPASAANVQGQRQPRKAQAHAQAAKAQPQAAQVQAAQPQVGPAPVQPAPPPQTPEQGPSSPPQVSFQGGQLTIEARNSTMADVLNAVKQKTGAAVDMPAVSSERVVGRFGPGAPRDVLAQLLNGSHYDYVLLGSPADPGALKKIVLMARAAGPEQVPSQQPATQAFQQNQNLQAVPEVDTDQNATDDSTSEVPPEVQQEEPQQPDQGQADQGQPGQNGPVVKTPEQLLRELQQQQQQQQQNAPPQ